MDLSIDTEQAEFVQWRSTPFLGPNVEYLACVMVLVVATSPGDYLPGISAPGNSYGDRITLDQNQLVDSVAKLGVKIQEAKSSLAHDFDERTAFQRAIGDLGLRVMLVLRVWKQRL